MDTGKIKAAFEPLHASPTVLTEVCKMTEEKKSHFSQKNIRPLLVAACLALALCITAYSAGVVEQIWGWSGNMEIQTDRENGNQTVILHTDALTEPVAFVNGRMIFLVNGELLDITDCVSQTEPFSYRYEDEEGLTHIWLVGLVGNSLEHYGYAEYIQDAEQNWLGGYSARINSRADGTTEAEWLNLWKEENACPW